MRGVAVLAVVFAACSESPSYKVAPQDGGHLDRLPDAVTDRGELPDAAPGLDGEQDAPPLDSLPDATPVEASVDSPADAAPQLDSQAQADVQLDSGGDDAAVDVGADVTVSQDTAPLPDASPPDIFVQLDAGGTCPWGCPSPFFTGCYEPKNLCYKAGQCTPESYSPLVLRDECVGENSCVYISGRGYVCSCTWSGQCRPGETCYQLQPPFGTGSICLLTP